MSVFRNAKQKFLQTCVSITVGGICSRNYFYIELYHIFFCWLGAILRKLQQSPQIGTNELPFCVSLRLAKDPQHYISDNI